MNGERKLALFMDIYYRGTAPMTRILCALRRS